MNTKSIEVYDPSMCCSSGVCGPEVDPKLVQSAADLKWLQERGVSVARHSLSQNPAAFVENGTVRAALTEKGESVLPLVFAGGTVLATGSYPSRAELAAAAGVPDEAGRLISPAVAELIAIGASVASHCEPCLRYHVSEAERLGVSAADMAGAVEIAARVKEAPHRSILRLASRLIPISQPAEEGSGCCGPATASTTEGGNRCCG